MIHVPHHKSKPDFSQMNTAYTDPHAHEEHSREEYWDPFSYDMDGNKIVTPPVKK